MKRFFITTSLTLTLLIFARAMAFAPEYSLITHEHLNKNLAAELPEPTPSPTPEPLLIDDMQESDVKIINGMEYVDVFTRKVTGYTPAPAENGGYNVTSLGKSLKANAGKIVAVSKRDLKLMPYGTKVYIEGIGIKTVGDTGCSTGIVDVLVSGNTHKIGNKTRKIYILKQNEQ